MTEQFEIDRKLYEDMYKSIINEKAELADQPGIDEYIDEKIRILNEMFPPTWH